MKSEKDLSDYRKVYQKSELLEHNIPDNPIQLFQNLEITPSDHIL